jgi:hypothetical protein
MEFRGQDTNTQAEAGNFKHIHLWLRNSILLDRMRDQEMVARAWMRMDMAEGGDFPAVFRFNVQDGRIFKLREGGLEVACIKERKWEYVVCVDKKLTACHSRKLGGYF